MSEQETLPPGLHPEIALLPWYANGTLRPDEQELVTRHLETCLDCRRELDELTQLQRELTTAYRTEDSPSPRLAQAVLAQVARESAEGRRTVSGEIGWMTGLDQWIRSLFMSQWVPTLVATIIAVQLGLLLWATMPQEATHQITTRSIDPPAFTVKVLFHEQATESQIRSLLGTVHGRIINGPDAKRSYTVAMPAEDNTAMTTLLDTLRARNDIVQTVEALSQ